MTVEQHDVVDFVSIDREGNATLTVSDHLPWMDLKGHLFHLQEKINGYLKFAESGEIYEKFPETRGRPVVISVVLKFPSPDAAQWFFTKTATAVQGAGCRLDVRLRGDN
jgi:hypothetical protein